MGNEIKLCRNQTIQQTTFADRTIRDLQPVPLVHTYHKTVQEFITDNSQFFSNDGLGIVHVLLKCDEFEQQINKFPIERITENKKIFLPNLTKEQFAVYTGQCLYLDFQNVELYVGEVDGGRKSGYGVLINGQGNKFDGSWSRDVQNGQGTLEILYPKRVYKGQWKNGKLQGHGSAVYQDGARFQGTFCQGKKHGMGILSFLDGASYEGSFYQDLMHGYGTLTTSKGRQISGEWKEGKYQIVKPDRTSKTFSINQLPVL